MMPQRSYPADPTRSGRALREPRLALDELVMVAVARAKEGDMSALQFLYTRYATEVRHYVTSIVGDEHDAEDITQSVFLKLIRVIGTYTQRDVPFVAWLRRVARNAALDNVRSKRLVQICELREGEYGRDELQSERIDELREVLQRLPFEQREVLMLRHLAGLSPREVARALHKTEAAVHAIQYRARNAFRATFRELEAMPRAN